jgi:hypothetical protein
MTHFNSLLAFYAEGSCMPKKIERPNARLTLLKRRVLVTKSEAYKLKSVYDHARHAVHDAFFSVHETLRELEKHGIGVPRLDLRLDSLTVEHATPREAISHLEHEGISSKCVRIAIQVEPFQDDTDGQFLDGLGISHLVGVYAKMNGAPNWQTQSAGGLLAMVDVPMKMLPLLLHDILLDMAMLRATTVPWSVLCDTQTSRQVESRKTDFAGKAGLLTSFAYGVPHGTGFLPISGLLRRPGSIKPQFAPEDIDLYIDLWCKFGGHCLTGTNIPPSPLEEFDVANLASRILSNYRNGGQISKPKLIRWLRMLGPGTYRLFFCLHRPQGVQIKTRLAAFFHSNPKSSRTQRWIIYQLGVNDAEAAYFIERNYVTFFTFEVRP